MNPSSIMDSHRQRKAYVYLRQSTPGQLRNHRESTERQYRFRNRARELGWPEERIEVLDHDLGQSGKQAESREDFKKLVTEVSMGRAGAVFSLEASRLSRSCADWHRLLELCALTASLIVDEDGIYDPTDFNDQLLLGLKGTMSQAELHFMRARLWGGKLNKAKKGELHFPLPVGLCYDSQGRTVLDPDQEIQGAVKLLFSWFTDCGSAYGVVRRFAQEKLLFPRRAYGGAWDGNVRWGPLELTRTLSVLHNPSYAGCYVFGRFGEHKSVSTDGAVTSKTVQKPEEGWRVCLKGHHQGYISWEQYTEHQIILQKNRTNEPASLLPGPARAGHALLQGLLVCAKCGHRISVRYKGNGGIYPMYECNGHHRKGLTSASCLSFRCDLADGPISRKAMEFVQPAKLEIALQAVTEIEGRRKAVEQQWDMRIQRAQYEADLACRRYGQVDPANRLVAGTLETQWNEALAKVQLLTRQRDQAHAEDAAPPVTAEIRRQIMALAENLPQVWNTSQARTKERKEILRLIIKDITVEKISQPRRLLLHVRWQGGMCEDILVDLPSKASEKFKYPEQAVTTVRTLAAQGKNDRQILQELDAAGQLTPRGDSYSLSKIRWIRHSHSIPSPCLRQPGELTVKETADKFGVSLGVVYYWIKCGIIHSRQDQNDGKTHWITINPAEEMEVKTKTKNAQRKSLNHQR